METFYSTYCLKEEREESYGIWFREAVGGQPARRQAFCDALVKKIHLECPQKWTHQCSFHVIEQEEVGSLVLMMARRLMAYQSDIQEGIRQESLFSDS